MIGNEILSKSPYSLCFLSNQQYGTCFTNRPSNIQSVVAKTSV